MSGDDLKLLVKKHPVSFGCGVLSLALAAGIYFRGGEIPESEAELAGRSAEAERFAANIKNAAQLKEHLDALVAANKEIDARIVRAGQLGINNQYFFKLESETGTKLVDFRQSPLQAVKGAKTVFAPVPFTVSVQGTLPQLFEFLHRLESGAHYCRVMSATCGVASANRGGVITLGLNLELLGLP